MKAFDEMIAAAPEHIKHFNLPYVVQGKFKETEYPGYHFSYSKYIEPETYYLTDSPINDNDLFMDESYTSEL